MGGGCTMWCAGALTPHHPLLACGTHTASPCPVLPRPQHALVGSCMHVPEMRKPTQMHLH